MNNDHYFPFAINLFGKYVESVSFVTIASFSDLLDGFLQIRFSWSTLWGHLSTSFNLRQIETNLGAVFLTRHTSWGILGRFETIVFLLSSPSHTSTFLRCSHCCPSPFLWIMELESQPNWSNCLLGSHTAEKTRWPKFDLYFSKLSKIVQLVRGQGRVGEINTFGNTNFSRGVFSNIALLFWTSIRSFGIPRLKGFWIILFLSNSMPALLVSIFITKCTDQWPVRGNGICPS